MEKEAMNEIKNLIEEMINEPEIIIVEGYKDKKALINLGIDKDFIITLKKPLYKIIEEVQEFGSCIILTDLDKKGKQYYKKLNSVLPQRGVKVNNRLRHFLFRHTKLRQVEGLYRYLEKNSKIQDL